MVRPKQKELTERELEVMHVFWSDSKALSAGDVRDRLEDAGVNRAYPTVANLVRGLSEKGLLNQTNDERPFFYVAAKSHDEVANNLVSDLVDRLFLGSREKLLVGLIGAKRLTAKERATLEKLLKDSK